MCTAQGLPGGLGRGQNTAGSLLPWAVGPEGMPFATSHKGTIPANSSPTPDLARPLGILTAPLTAPSMLTTQRAGPLNHMGPCIVTQLVPMTNLFSHNSPSIYCLQPLASLVLGLEYRLSRFYFLKPTFLLKPSRRPTLSKSLLRPHSGTSPHSLRPLSHRFALLWCLALTITCLRYQPSPLLGLGHCAKHSPYFSSRNPPVTHVTMPIL